MVDMVSLRALTANAQLRQRLQSLKEHGRHLGQTGKGLMIDDAETVSLVAKLADRMGVTKREAVMHALKAMSETAIEQFDVVALTRPFDNLPAGIEGTVMMLHEGGCEVDFQSDDGQTRGIPLDALKLRWKAAQSDA